LCLVVCSAADAQPATFPERPVHLVVPFGPGHEKELRYRETIDAVLAWAPPGPAREKILAGNALELYFQ
jgi:hypothetical protein